MPNFSGIWTITQQMQAKGASTWPATPGAPTIGTATAGTSSCASVTFTAPSCAGYPATVTGYRVISTPGCFTQTGASSPLTVTGLTSGTSYTFKAQATNATGYGCLSAASNSVTASNAGSTYYASAGTFSWVAPSGVTKVSVVAVGGGGGGAYANGGGGGALAYKNNITVIPGNSYTIVVGAGGTGTCATSFNCNNGGQSYFCNTGLVKASGGWGGYSSCGGSNNTYVGDGGGSGGLNRPSGTDREGGGGAGGYSGNGGYGSTAVNGSNTGTAGAGGGGGGGGGKQACAIGGNGGGGVGPNGQGSNGALGARGSGGGGGSGGCTGASGTTPYGGNGGAYGGGGGSGAYYSGSLQRGGNGRVGIVRIIWPGNTRSFPSTCAGSP